MATKPKGKLDKLPPEQFDLLVEWLSIEGITYVEAITRLDDQFGVSSTPSALCKFYERYCLGYKNSRAKSLSSQVRQMFESDPDNNFGDATLKAIEQRAFELSVAKDASVKELNTLAGILGDSRRLELQQRKLELDVNKWRSAVKTDIEKGLDALQAEIKGNAQALELFNQMKAIFIKSVEETAG